MIAGPKLSAVSGPSAPTEGTHPVPALAAGPDGSSFAASILGTARPAWVYASAAALLVVLCSGVLLPWWISIDRLWMRDPLRSIGAWFPLVSLLGVLYAWRRFGWTMDGTYWGLVPIAVSAPLAHLVLVRLPYLYIHGHELGLVKFFSPFFLCAVGAVLLFGGPRLLRACWPPLLLLLLLDPVPHFYNQWLDLPLQQLSANTARSFAHLIGLQPTGLQLRMMFTPSFGMMIVPGCDGIRGSVTFGYLALFYGYSRGLRARTLAGVVVAAVFAGFAINLTRLCVLVLYYRAGMSLVSIQRYGAQVDYAIGCSLFLIAALGLGLFIRSLKPKAEANLPESFVDSRQPSAGEARSMLLRAACLAVLTMAYLASEIHAMPQAFVKPRSEEAIFAMFPATVGSYRLVRTHGESFANDSLAFAFGDYEQAGEAGAPPSRITLGLWVHSRYHQVADSRQTNGSKPIWTGAFNANADMPVHFTSHMFEDGSVQEYDADTICSVDMCSDNPLKDAFTLGTGQTGHIQFALSQSNRLPIVLQRTWSSSDPSQLPALRSSFESDARVFTRNLKLQPLVLQIGSQF